MKKTFTLLCLTASLLAEESFEPSCDMQPYHLGIRHIEANGIGYNQGYSTLEGFFTLPSSLDTSLIPFFDIRGHVFNDGKFAANAGVGVRYLSSMVWGVNAYYDFRETHRKNYNQVAVGFEALGKVWDFRWNGYFPVGEKTSHFYHTKFHSYKGNHFYISRKQEVAMTGTNAEAGAHFNAGHHVHMYAAAGPYYFAGEGRQAWGGQARLLATLYDYVGLQLSGSYDSVFRGIMQGEISFRIPLGSKKEVAKNASCRLSQRALQPVDRNEIVVLTHKRKKSLAINPATKKPWVLWFVDNTSHSQGTFESPFNTLKAAEDASSPHDAIIILTGDGTDAGQSMGIRLKDAQMLLGAGIPHPFATTHGTVLAPAISRGLPTISNLTSGAGGHVVELANNNEISGLFINDEQGTRAINADSQQGTNARINNNVIQTISVGEAIRLFNNTAIGHVVIDNNKLLGGDSSGNFGIFTNNITNGLIEVTNNYFSGANSTSNIGSALSIGYNAPDIAGAITFHVANNVARQLVTGESGTLEITHSLGLTTEICTRLRHNDFDPVPGGASYYFSNSNPPSLMNVVFDQNNIGTFQVENLNNITFVPSCGN